MDADVQSCHRPKREINNTIKTNGENKTAEQMQITLNKQISNHKWYHHLAGTTIEVTDDHLGNYYALHKYRIHPVHGTLISHHGLIGLGDINNIGNTFSKL
jgi:hypothetical protein